MGVTDSSKRLLTSTLTPNYYDMIDELQTELQRFTEEKTRIDAQIQRLVKAIEAIQAVAQESTPRIMEPPSLAPDEESGFTDRVRAVLTANSLRFITAVEIRNFLMTQTPKDDPKIMLIHIHNTLKRLHRQGEIDEEEVGEGKKGYRVKNTWLWIIQDLVKGTTNQSAEAKQKTPGEFKREIEGRLSRK